MKNNPNRFWILVIALGWIFDFLFWKKPAGVNFAIFVILCVTTGIFILQWDGLRISQLAGLLLIPIAFFSAMTFIRLEPMTMFLSVSMTLFLMGVFALTYINGQWTCYGLVDYALGYLQLIGSMIARPLRFGMEVRSEQPSLSEKRSNPVWSILRGAVIALPVIAIFATLLSSADPIFAKRFDDLINLFRIQNLPEYIFRFAYILVVAYALAGIYLHAAQKSGEKKEEKNLLPSFLGFTESSIVLGGVVILFLAFVIVQFQYFFGGQANIHIEGYTYSEYARKGFGELVAVAFCSLLLLLGLGTITRRETETQRRLFSILGVSLVVLVIIMLVSAFQRLTLYEAAYGFSRLRTYTHVFMIWLGLLLVAVVVLELVRRERVAGLAMLLASIGFIASLSLLNVDAFIVKQNVQREMSMANKTSKLDAQYFLDLSDDAVPALVASFTNQSLPTAVHDKLGAALACKHFERTQTTDQLSWQSFHFSRWNADRAFASIERELDVYTVNNVDGYEKVTMPTGEEISCWSSFMD